MVLLNYNTFDYLFIKIMNFKVLTINFLKDLKLWQSSTKLFQINNTK